LPISLPIIATLGVFYAVGYWNNYFHPVLFISKISLNPLQVFVYDMISSTNDMLAEQPEEVRVTLSPEGLRASTVIASVLPILLVYPFLQRYFIHGMTLGSVKG